MRNLKKIGWIAIPVLLSIGVYFGYQHYMKPEPEPISVPKEERFFQDDGASLNWLEDPTIQEENSIEEEALTDQASGKSPSNKMEPPSVHPEKAQVIKESGQPVIDPPALQSKPKDPLADIKERYTVKFKKLERSYQGRLKSLIGEAKGEYTAIKNGEKDVSVMSLAAQYMKKAQQMEKQADVQFYDVLSQMEQELRAKGLSTELIKNAEIEYEERKRNQRAALIQKFASKM